MSTGSDADRIRTEEAGAVTGGGLPPASSAGTLPAISVGEAVAPIGPPVASAPEVVKYPVVLVIPGVGPRKFNVLPGTTVEDVIREAGVSTEGQDVMISNTRVEGAHIIGPAEKVIFMVPRPKNAAEAFWTMVASLLLV